MPSPCPCGSGASYDACCGPLLDGHPAPTAERLMRSRYTAFVRGHRDHLWRTWHPRSRPPEVALPAQTQWLGLEVLRTEDGGADDQSGTVEFLARYAGGELRENSWFVRRAGRWFYLGPE